jgi:hypothetical protein
MIAETNLAAEAREAVMRCYRAALEAAADDDSLTKSAGAAKPPTKAGMMARSPVGVIGNFETELRQRMLDELRHHTDRAGTSHTHFWERLFAKATPEDLATLIQEAMEAADAKEKADKDQELEEKHGIKGIEDRLGAVEDHLVGDGDGRFPGPEDEQEQPTDVNSPDTGRNTAALLSHYRGRPLGVEAKKPDADEWAMTTPDPTKPGGGRVTTYGPHGVTAQSTHEDPHEALAHMAAAGYTDPDPGSYSDHSNGPDWDWHHAAARQTSAANKMRAAGQDKEATQHEAEFYAQHPHPASRAERSKSKGSGKKHAAELGAAVKKLHKALADMEVEDATAAP